MPDVFKMFSPGNRREWTATRISSESGSELQIPTRWVQLRNFLRIQGLSIAKDPHSGEISATLTLRFVEGHPDSQNDQRSKRVMEDIRLTLLVEGKEIALLSGLLDREISISGEQSEDDLSLDSLVKENEDLKTRLKEQEFQIQSLLQGLQGPNIRRLHA
jgi:hypothetical protein